MQVKSFAFPMAFGLSHPSTDLLPGEDTSQQPHKKGFPPAVIDPADRYKAQIDACTKEAEKHHYAYTQGDTVHLSSKENRHQIFVPGDYQKEDGTWFDKETHQKIPESNLPEKHITIEIIKPCEVVCSEKNRLILCSFADQELKNLVFLQQGVSGNSLEKDFHDALKGFWKQVVTVWKSGSDEARSKLEEYVTVTELQAPLSRENAQRVLDIIAASTSSTAP